MAGLVFLVPVTYSIVSILGGGHINDGKLPQVEDEHGRLREGSSATDQYFGSCSRRVS